MDTKIPAFCPPNITLSDIWVNHGVSHCFVDTVASSTIAGFIFIFGIAQLIIYKKYSTRIDVRRIQPSFLYKLQIFLMLLLPILVATRLDLQWNYYESVHVYGYMVSRRRFLLTFKFIQFSTAFRFFTRHWQSSHIYSRSAWSSKSVTTSCLQCQLAVTVSSCWSSSPSSSSRRTCRWSTSTRKTGGSICSPSKTASKWRCLLRDMSALCSCSCSDWRRQELQAWLPRMKTS